MLSVYNAGCAPMPGQPSFHSPQKYLVGSQPMKGKKRTDHEFYTQRILGKNIRLWIIVFDKCY